MKSLKATSFMKCQMISELLFRILKMFILMSIKPTFNPFVSGESSKVVLKRSIEQHALICIENSEDVYDALDLVKLLNRRY